MAVREDTIASRREDLISESVFDDVVVLDPETGRFVRLNGSAAELWGALATSPTSVAALAEILVTRLAAPPERALSDASAFVESMSSRNLLTLSTAL